MKRIKHHEKESVRRTLTLSSSDEDSSENESNCTKSSSQSLGQWAKRSDNEIGPLIRRSVPRSKIKPKKIWAPAPSRVVSAEKDNFFDLSQEDCTEHSLLPGLRFDTLKIRHELFFSYDPRGSKVADARYCPHCNCPKSYCCELVFGEVTKNQTKFFIEEIGGLNTKGVDGDSTYYNFLKILSEEVHHKMLTNGIKVPSGYNFHTLVRMPECVFQGSLKELFDDCAKTKYMKFELGNPWENKDKKRKST